ncbi:MAG: hypothetical protein ACR2LV_03715 [Solirubrobacteraceae bacterium]
MAAAPAAQARTHHPGASVHGVMVHVHRADRALAGVVAGNSRDLKVLRVQGSAALKEAQSLARHARRARGRVQAARALSSVERQFARDTGQLSGVLALEPSFAQAGIAGTIAGSTLGEQIAASVLAKILPLLPAAAQGPVSEILAQLPAQETTQASHLAASLDAGSIVCAASGAVEQALTLATQAIGIGLSQAQSALAMVPGGVGSEFQGVLSGLPGQLTGIESLVQGILPCASSNSTPPGSSTGSSILPVDSVSLISGITKLINEILSEVLPAAGQGQSGVSTPIPGNLGGLVGGFGAIPGLAAGMPGFSGIPFLSGGIPGFSGGFPFLSGGMPF